MATSSANSKTIPTLLRRSLDGITLPSAPRQIGLANSLARSFQANRSSQFAAHFVRYHNQSNRWLQNRLVGMGLQPGILSRQIIARHFNFVDPAHAPTQRIMRMPRRRPAPISNRPAAGFDFEPFFDTSETALPVINRTTDYSSGEAAWANPTESDLPTYADAPTYFESEDRFEADVAAFEPFGQEPQFAPAELRQPEARPTRVFNFTPPVLATIHRALEPQRAAGTASPQAEMQEPSSADFSRDFSEPFAAASSAPSALSLALERVAKEPAEADDSVSYTPRSGPPMIVKKGEGGELVNIPPPFELAPALEIGRPSSEVARLYQPSAEQIPGQTSLSNRFENRSEVASLPQEASEVAQNRAEWVAQLPTLRYTPGLTEPAIARTMENFEQSILSPAGFTEISRIVAERQTTPLAGAISPASQSARKSGAGEVALAGQEAVASRSMDSAELSTISHTGGAALLSPMTAASPLTSVQSSDAVSASPLISFSPASFAATALPAALERVVARLQAGQPEVGQPSLQRPEAFSETSGPTMILRRREETIAPSSTSNAPISTSNAPTSTSSAPISASNFVSTGQTNGEGYVARIANQTPAGMPAPAIGFEADLFGAATAPSFVQSLPALRYNPGLGGLIERSSHPEAATEVSRIHTTRETAADSQVAREVARPTQAAFNSALSVGLANLGLMPTAAHTGRPGLINNPAGQPETATLSAGPTPIARAVERLEADRDQSAESFYATAATISPPMIFGAPALAQQRVGDYRPATPPAQPSFEAGAESLGFEPVARPYQPTAAVEAAEPPEAATAMPLGLIHTSEAATAAPLGLIHPTAWIQRKARPDGPAAPASPIGLSTPLQLSVNRSISNFVPPALGSLHAPDIIMRAGPGKPLDSSVQTSLSPVFGSNLEHVRVHDNDRAADFATEIGAEAFTVGSNIFFGAGRYQPGTTSGQALIGHELTHVFQQASFPSLGNGRIPETSGEGETLEREAIQNEQLILRHLEQSKSTGPADLGTARSTPLQTTTGPTVARSFEPVTSTHLQTEHRETATPNAAIQREITETSSAPTSGHGNEHAEGATGHNGPDIEALAQQVLRILKQELVIERERSGLRGGSF